MRLFFIVDESKEEKICIRIENKSFTHMKVSEVETLKKAA